MARKIEVQLVGDSRSLERAFGRSQTAGSKLGKAVGVGLKVAAAAGAAGIAGLAVVAKKGFDEFTEAQRVTAQTNAVLKSTGRVANVTAKDVADLSEELMHMSGVDDELIASSQNVLLTFTNVRNEVGKGNDVFNQATRLILDMSVALGTDLQSSTIQVGKALNDPIKGITALTRVGVSFTQGQKDQIEALVKSGQKMEAQKLILAELRKEFGGSAKAAGKTLAGQINILRESFNNWAGDLVGKVMPAFQDFLQRFTRAKGFTAKLKVIWTGINEAAEDLVRILRDAIQMGLQRADWSAIGQRIGDEIASKVRITADFLNRFLATAHAWVDTNLGKLADIGAKLMLAIVAKLLDPGFWRENWRLIGTVAIAVFPLGRFATLGSRLARAMIQPVLRILPAGFRTASGLAIRAIGTLISWISGPFRSALARIPGWLRAAFKVSIVTSAITAIRNAVQSLVETVRNIVNRIREIWNRLPGIIRAVVPSFLPVIGGFQRLWGLVQLVINAVRDLAGAIRALPDIPSIPNPLDILPGRQHGGSVTAGRAYVVGERRPEVFVPRQSGRIIPRVSHAGGGGGGGFPGDPVVILTSQRVAKWLQNLNGDYSRQNGGRSIW